MQKRAQKAIDGAKRYRSRFAVSKAEIKLALSVQNAALEDNSSDC